MHRLQGVAQDEVFLTRVYSEAERDEAERQADKERYFCSRFSAKEAVFKSLGIPPDSVRLNEIEICKGEHGKPIVNLLGKVKNLAEARDVKEVHLSLSWEEDYVVAFAVACG